MYYPNMKGLVTLVFLVIFLAAGYIAGAMNSGNSDTQAADPANIADKDIIATNAVLVAKKVVR